MRTTPPFPPNTGKDWIEEFAAGLAREDLSPKTILGYRQDLKGFFQWFQATRGAEADLSQLSSIDLIQYRQHLLHTQQRKLTTINRHLQALRRFCRWGKGCGIFQDDPSAGVRAVRLSPHTLRHTFALPSDPTEEELTRDWNLSEDDQAQVLSCRGEANRLRFAVQLCTLRNYGRFL